MYVGRGVLAGHPARGVGNSATAMPAPWSVSMVRSTTAYSSGFRGGSVGNGVWVGRGVAVGDAWSRPSCTASARSTLQVCRTSWWVQ